MSREAFISHASVDAELARAICEGLERRGVACWIAPRDIAPEGTYGTEIIKGLRECPVFLIVLTGASADSQQVEREAERASHYQKRIIPLAVGQSEPGERLEFYTAGRQRLACTATIDDGFLDRLAALVRGERATPAATAPVRPARGRWPFAAFAAAAVALVAGGAWWIATKEPAAPASPAPSHTSSVPPAAPPRTVSENPRPLEEPARPPQTKPSAAQRASVPAAGVPPVVRASESSRGAGGGVPDPVPSTSAAPASELTVNGATLRFVALPAGTYKMGCSPGDDNCTDVEKVLNVAVDPFQISATEVTQAFWQATMGSNPSDFQGPMRPVHNVSWPEGVAFMERLNQHSHGFRYRLPTEAEWEYAARARSGTPDPLPGFAWFGLLSSSGSAARPQDVAGKKPNAWGLYDMLGNVAEWCEDWFSPNFQRVVRGGSWQDGPTSVRVSARSKALPSTRDSWIGLRVVRTAR